MLYQRSYSSGTQKQNRGIIAKKTTGSLCCTRGHTSTETKPWYYSQENYRKSKLYQRSYSHRNKTVVLQPRKLQEVYVVPEIILPQKQNRGIIAKKTTGSLCCTRCHTPTETKPWYYSQRSYSHRNKTVVLQPRKLQEVYVVPEVILPQKQNRGIIAKKTTGSLCCCHTPTEIKPWYYSRNYKLPQSHTPTETKPWYYSQENYRKSMLYQRSYSHRNKTVVLQPRKTTGSLCCTRGHTPTETKPWYHSQEDYRKSMLYRGHTSTETKTVVLQPRKPQEV